MIRLAVDMDGVLADCFSYWQSLGYKEGVQDPFDHAYNGIYKVYCSDGELFADKLFGEYRDEWILGSKPFPDVHEFIKDINRNDHIQWWVVTSRGADVRPQTIDWLDTNGITGYEGVIFTKDKLEAPCNTIVDDKPSHVQSYQKNARMGYLLSRSYNMGATVSRRADNLQQVYQNLLQFV